MFRHWCAYAGEYRLDWRRNPGWIVSAAAHGALLAGLIVALPDARKFTDAQEAVPVEILTEEQVNQIVKGDKQAQKQNPNPRADKVDDKPESNPQPPVAEARQNIPTPPPPLKRLPDPGQDDTPAPADPAPKVAALPPPRPERESEPEPPPAPPARPPEPAKPTAAEPPKPVEKEALVPMPPVRPVIEPKPEPRPDIKKLAAKPPEKPVTEPQDKPEPPVPLPPRRPRDLPRVAKPKPQPDRIAKLIEPQNRDSARPKSGDDANEPPRKFDRNAIANILQSKESAQRRGSTGKQLQRESRLGSPTANAAKMSPSMWGQLDGLMQEQYKRCWGYIGLASGKRYIPQIRVSYSVSGQLTSAPVLLNPPADPALRSLAESAVRAVRKCDPLRIPAQFAPYHDQWKSRVLRFDPEEMMG